jgi:WD40 repeat protein
LFLRHLAVKSQPSQVTLELRTLRGNGHGYSVAWNPDGRRLATVGDFYTAKVWDAASGKELRTLPGQGSSIRSVTWSPDGERLATAGDDFLAKVWNAANGKELLTLRGHKSPVNSVAWRRDGERIATGSLDTTAKVWDSASGKELLTLPGHTKSVESVAWSPDGKRLASAGADGIVQVYAMDIHDLMKLARGRVTRELTPEECERYLQNRKCSALP